MGEAYGLAGAAGFALPVWRLAGAAAAGAAAAVALSASKAVITSFVTSMLFEA
ncbi:MAG: hypothetical protein U5J83_01810 [Bryobacterales bacterium]|nr:hypothetical protein [Bryobacterales bacterium]